MLNSDFKIIEGLSNHYNKIYNKTFKCENIKIRDYLNSFCDSPSEYYAEYEEITSDLYCNVVYALFNIHNPKVEDGINSGEYESWIDNNTDLIKSYTIFTEDTLVCDTCNYKGEGDGVGFSLSSLCDGMCEFASKRESFINC